MAKAKPGTLAELELTNRAMLLLCRLPHLLDEASLCLLVELVDSSIFQLLSMATSGEDNIQRRLKETGKSVLLVLEEWSQENRSALLKGCVDSLSGAIINLNLPVWLRTICIKGFNQLLEKARKDEKGLVWERLSVRMDELFRFLLTCGVYDTQAAVVEFIFRFGQNLMQIQYVNMNNVLPGFCLRLSARVSSRPILLKSKLLNSF